MKHKIFLDRELIRRIDHVIELIDLSNEKSFVMLYEDGNGIGTKIDLVLPIEVAGEEQRIKVNITDVDEW